MLSKDKEFIQNKACAGFDLAALREAREQIFRYCEPEERYTYKGPYSVKHDREKAAHAFEGIYSKLHDLDLHASMPVIVCPAEELHLLPPIKSDTTDNRTEERFSSIERTLQGMQTQIQEMVKVHTLSSISADTKKRLVAKRVRPDDDIAGASDFSENETDDGFVYQRNQRRKLEKGRSSKREECEFEEWEFIKTEA